MTYKVSQEQRDARAQKLIEEAKKLDERARKLMEPYEAKHFDLAWHTQPALPNTPFAKRREKVHQNYLTGLELLNQARKLRDRALSLSVDREERNQRRLDELQRERDQADAVLEKGSRVRHKYFGTGEIIRVNRITYQVRFDHHGIVQKVDKSLVWPEEAE